MRLNCFLFGLVLAAVLSACAATTEDTATETNVVFSAAFTELARTDVYDMSGNFIQTVDDSADFQEVLPVGLYLMDFVNTDGEHSFMEDGRLAFVPMMTGAMPEDEPVFVDSSDYPFWQIEVHPALEGNAHLSIRVADGDETLRPWEYFFSDWQANLPEEDRDQIEDSDGWTAEGKSYSTTTGSTTTRLRVTWEASFAMTGDYSNTKGYTCTSSTNCWRRRGRERERSVRRVQWRQGIHRLRHRSMESSHHGVHQFERQCDIEWHFSDRRHQVHLSKYFRYLHRNHASTRWSVQGVQQPLVVSKRPIQVDRLESWLLQVNPESEHGLLQHHDLSSTHHQHDCRRRCLAKNRLLQRFVHTRSEDRGRDDRHEEPAHHARRCL